MFRKLIPRMYELRDLAIEYGTDDRYFLHFEHELQVGPSAMTECRALESDLQTLDVEAWEFLKDEARNCLKKKNPGAREMERFVNILNQARGYKFLVRSGCSSIHFIPRSKEKTPDLEAQESGRRILCEVKTVNVSDAELARRKSGEAHPTETLLKTGFFKQLASDLEYAKEQMYSYDNSPDTKKIAYVILNFDEFVGDYTLDFFEQIDQCLEQHNLSLEIVFHNRALIRKPIRMKHAIVVND